LEGTFINWFAPKEKRAQKEREIMYTFISPLCWVLVALCVPFLGLLGLWVLSLSLFVLSFSPLAGWVFHLMQLARVSSFNLLEMSPNWSLGNWTHSKVCA
jgi:hypothetical protein